jgi:uncharacterized protein (DUF4213/DUF364 family)
MELNRKLFASVSADAEGVMVDQVTIGLGYTAVTTSSGSIGIAATGVAVDGCCPGSLDMIDYEQRPAIELLQCILAADPMGRAMALALVNALNHRRAAGYPEDSKNTTLFDRFGILTGAHVAMVGYFPPLVRFLEQNKVPLSVIDRARGLGDTTTFYRQLESWADVLLLTATSIINNTAEPILSHTAPRVKTAILGPTTPMLPGAFDHLPVHMLAGTAITDRSAVLKIVRHGGGARDLKPFSRKVYWSRNDMRHEVE